MKTRPEIVVAFLSTFTAIVLAVLYHNQSLELVRVSAELERASSIAEVRDTYISKLEESTRALAPTLRSINNDLEDHPLDPKIVHIITENLAVRGETARAMKSAITDGRMTDAIDEYVSMVVETRKLVRDQRFKHKLGPFYDSYQILVEYQTELFTKLRQMESTTS